MAALTAERMNQPSRTYKCAGKKGCGRTFVQNADLEQRNNAMVEPDRCPLFNGQRQRCPGTNLQLVKDGSVHTDYQEIKIQEAASKIGVGNIPRSLLIKLQHDLVDKCQPGDEVVVVGNLLAQWQQSPQQGLECNVGMALKAHSVRVIQDNGSSAWEQTGAESSMVGEVEKFKKEFDAFWDGEDQQKSPFAARDFICTAVCPKLYGLQIIKLALLITLIGGVPSSSYEKSETHPKESDGNNTDGEIESDVIDEPQPFRVIQNEPSSVGPVYGEKSNVSRVQKKKDAAVQTRRRDMSHMLIIGGMYLVLVAICRTVGMSRYYEVSSIPLAHFPPIPFLRFVDPGTGKSQILRFAAALCPRAVLTTGVGTTSAGLTCAAVREGNDKDFALEAGALVLADKGVCCIDEFGCIRNEDRTTIHEAMEQQTLSVAKAGIVCKLNCRATVIAVMNPRDCIYDTQATLSHNTGLGTPLLSRFDLIFKLVDSPDAERDSQVTQYLLNRAIQGAGYECANPTPGSGFGAVPWSMEKLRSYISIVKERFHPAINDEAALLLERHYEKVRSAQSNVIPITVRFLESLIRLTQAHARLMYRNVATLDDAVAVLRVMECSAYAYGGFDGNVPDVQNVLYVDPMQMDCSFYSPDEDFMIFKYQILLRYDMLESMAKELQERALQLLGSNDDSCTWQDLSNPHDRVVEDHYGRHHYSPIFNQGIKRRKTQ
jgi:DNA replicative helicase MCM subunit Mcm2 (Cdc46/Mcm family)